MLRLTLLLPLIFALSFRAEYALHVPGGAWIFLGVLAAMVLGVRARAERIAAESGEVDIDESAAKLGRITEKARAAVMLWAGAGLYLFGWHELVVRPGAVAYSATLVPAVLCSLPSYLAWVGLYWAQYPAERAVREQAMVAQLNAGIPVRRSLSLGTYLDNHVRSGLAVLVVPSFGALAIRDGLWLAVRSTPWAGSDWVRGAVYLLPALAVFLLAPALLRHVFRTRRLPEGALRVRLSGLAQRAKVSFSDVLVWDTHSAVANALVMGVVPGLRYVLLSDLLIETMSDEEIEAVFAHELGHIVHRHMAWYVAFLVSGSLLLGWLDVPAKWVGPRWHLDEAWELGSALATIGLLLLGFGALSRRFEKQADVYAARSLTPTDAPLAAPVMPMGAAVFGQALQRVAMVNNMSVSSHSWSHGSIVSRIDSLLRISENARRTAEFDELQYWIRLGVCAVVIGGVATGVWLGFE